MRLLSPMATFALAVTLSLPNAMANDSNDSRTAAPADTAKPPSTLPTASCRSESVGRVVGGLLGAAIGRQVAGDDRRTAGTVGGALAGIWLGGAIGRKLDAGQPACQDKPTPEAPAPGATPSPMPGSGRTAAPPEADGPLSLPRADHRLSVATA